MRYLFIISLCIFSFFESKAQSRTNRGTEFWMSFMQHIDIGANHQILITSKFNATVNIHIPNKSFNSTVVVPAGGIAQVPITDPAGVQPIGEGLNNTAIHITSDLEITVYAHQYSAFRSEASLILPIQTLGNEYFVMTFEPHLGYFSEFVIVAVEDQTILDITPSVTTRAGKVAGIPFQVTIDSGEVYQVQSSGDLTGSHVKSQKNCAVFAGATFAGIPVTIGTRDNLYEQMFPLFSFGQKYMLTNFDNSARTPGFPSGPYFDIFRVLASEDNTDIYVDDLLLGTINKGQFIEDSLFGPIVIETSKPTLVTEYMISNYGGNASFKGDPSMVILNEVELALDTAVFFASSLQNITNNYVNIYCHTADTNQIFLDGTSLADTFSAFPADSTLSYAVLEITSGSHTLISNGCNGFQAITYGLGGAESFAYAAGVNLVKSLDISIVNLNTDALPNSGCVLDTFKYNAFSPDSIISLIWNFGDPASGSLDTSTATNPQHIYLDTGDYVITVFAAIYKKCFIDTIVDTQVISIGRIDTTLFFSADTVCTNMPVQFLDSSVSSNSNIISYNWTFGDGFSDTVQNPLHSYTSFGNYQIVLNITTDHGCRGADTSPIHVLDPPTFIALGDTVVCSNLIATIGNTSINGQGYAWSPTIGLDDPTISNPTINLTSNNPQTINYVLVVTDKSSNCSLIDSVNITFNGQLTLNNGIDSIAILQEECVDIVISSNGTPPYIWIPTSFTTFVPPNTIAVCPEETFTYNVSDSNNCTNNIIIKVIKLFQIDVPKAFTPNGDDLNDVLNLLDIGIDKLKYFKIFNRWGQLVFFTNDINSGWDGTFNEKEQPSGQYVFELEAISLEGDVINKTGSFALIR